MGEVVSDKLTSLLNVELSTPSSTIPDVTDSETKQLTTVIIFVISAIFAIALLFVIAVFIDCRQEKLKNLQIKTKKKVLQVRLPIPFLVSSRQDDEHSILDKIEYGNPSVSEEA